MSEVQSQDTGWRWQDAFPAHLGTRIALSGSVCELECGRGAIPEACAVLTRECKHVFAGLIVEERTEQVQLRYVFCAPHPDGWTHVVVSGSVDERVFPSISSAIHAADWHEREAEDLFGVVFTGHPRLGDFVLHDDRWQENLAPMRPRFDAFAAVKKREPNMNWKPRRIVQARGAFAMPIGPIFSGETEPVHFLLETVGEDVIRTIVRLFYQYRGVEKIAEGRSAADALLLAERFAATTAFAHAVAYCQAVESVCGTAVPPRARRLRVFMLELERLRHHAGAIREICESTALAVATSQAAIIEEDLLRLSGELTGHRYLFGMCVCGGLSQDPGDHSLRAGASRAQVMLERLDALEEMLRTSSSFLDRLEEVGFIRASDAIDYGLVGPVARASGLSRDMRRMQPYSGYEEFSFAVPVEEQGDGFARLRVLFAEARESAKIMSRTASDLPDGPVASDMSWTEGAALGWVEAPRGAAFHWVRLGPAGVTQRYRIMPPSFANWHGFHLAAENFAFQDFPIILATFGLSVAESDR